MVSRTYREMSRVWSFGSLAAVGMVVLVYFSLPAGVKLFVFDGVGVAAAAAMFVGIVGNRAEPRFAWALLAAGMLLMAGGDIVFGTTQPVPSTADMLYVSAYVVLALGFVGLARSEIPSRKESSLVLDAIIVAAGVGIVGILFLIVPAAHPDGVGLAAQAVSVGYPLIDLGLLIVLLRPARLNTAQRTVFLLLAAGLFLRLVADTTYALLNFGTAYVEGHPADAFWLLSYACFAAALLHPAIARAKVDPSSVWTAKSPFVLDGEPEMYPKAAWIIQSQAIRFRAILSWAGMILLVLAGGTLFLAMSWRAPEVMLVAGAYGGSGSLILIASVITS